MGHGGYFRPRRKNEACRSVSCMPPWFVFWRWSNGGEAGDHSKNRFIERIWKKGKIKGKLDGGKVKRGVRNYEAASSSRENDSGEIGKEASINLGVGLGLIYFVKDELNKMVELRQNIELLLQEYRTELQNHDKKPVTMPSKSRISSSFSNTGVQETMNVEENNGDQRLSSNAGVERPATGFSSGRYRRDRSLRMDQLEAELEAEFDRLQITSDSFNYSKQQYSEVNVDDSAPELSLNMCYEDENGPQDEFYGVSPRELERKLHEVLETRHEERINELESALDYAMQQLDEKERELASWKDAARLISRHFPDIHGVLRQAEQGRVYCTESEFEGEERGRSLVKSSIWGARAI